MVNQGQKPISIWYRGCLLFTPGFLLILCLQFPMAIFKLAFGCMQHFSWIAGLRLISPGFWCLQCRHLFPESPASFLTDDRESHALSLILAKDLKYIRRIVGELIPLGWLPSPACMSITLILMHFSPNNKCKPWQCVCYVSPRSEVGCMAPATEPWMICQTVRFHIIWGLLICLIQSFMPQVEQQPTNPLSLVLAAGCRPAG